MGIVLDLSVGVDNRGGGACRPRGGGTGSVPARPWRLGPVIPAEAVLHARCSASMKSLLSSSGGLLVGEVTGGGHRRADGDDPHDDDCQQHETGLGRRVTVPVSRGPSEDSGDEEAVEAQQGCASNGRYLKCLAIRSAGRLDDADTRHDGDEGGEYQGGH